MATNKKGLWYGWVVLGVGFLVMLVIGVIYFAFGIFLKPMIADLGTGRGEATIGLTIMMVLGGLLGPVVAVAINKFGVRLIMSAGMIVLAIGLSLLSTVTQVWQLWLLLGVVIGVGMAFGTMLPATTMVNYWFAKRKALALGIAMSGVGIGTFVMAPVIAYLIDSIGWRASWLVLAGITLFFGAIPSLIFARTKPEDMGQLPDGAISAAAEQSATPSAKKGGTMPVEWTAKAGLRTPALWLIALFGTVTLFALNMMNAHQMAYLTDMGISSMAAATALSVLVGAGTFGNLLGGILGDKMETRYLVAVACLMAAIGLIIFINATGMALVYVYVLLFGMAYGLVFALQPTMVGAYYGPKAYPSLFAAVALVQSLIAAISPPFGGFMWNAVGSYTIPFAASAGVVALGIVCALLARPPQPSLNPGEVLSQEQVADQ